MGLTVNHVLTMTSPVDTNYENTPGNWNSIHAFTLDASIGLNTAITGGLMTGNSSGLSINLSGQVTLSSYLNEIPMTGLSQLSTGSVSDAVAFYLPNYLSASYLRLPASFANGSTTLATTNASLSASVQRAYTYNAAFYTLGTGANSSLLSLYTSGSLGHTVMNSVSITGGGTQGSYTVAMSFGALGTTTNVTTQYSVSDTNMPFSSTLWANYSGNRFLDIPLAVSFTPGQYWLVFGVSSSSGTNSTGISLASANIANAFKSAYYMTQTNQAFGVAGSTNLTSGAMLGAGQFSTAGGGTTANLPLSAISSIATHPLLCFQLLRSA